MSLSRFLLGQACIFAPDAKTGALLGTRGTLHHVAIATELALKAWIAHHDMTDTWLKRYVRHDLARAWRLADALGLDADPDLHRIVDQLDPHFRKGGFQHEPDFWTSGFEMEAPVLLDRLIARVAARL